MKEEEFQGLFSRIAPIYMSGGLQAVIDHLKRKHNPDGLPAWKASLSLVGHLKDRPEIETCLGELMAFAPGVVLFVPSGRDVPVEAVCLMHIWSGREVKMPEGRRLTGTRDGLILFRPRPEVTAPGTGDFAWVTNYAEFEGGSVDMYHCPLERLGQLDFFLGTWLPID